MQLKKPTLTTKIGWGLTAGLTVLALLPWANVAITLGGLVLGIALAVVIYLATTRSRVDKLVTIPITNIGPQDRLRYRDALEALFKGLGRVESIDDDGSGLKFVVRTDLDLATLHRQVKRLLGKPLYATSIEGTVSFSALTATGAAEISLSGQVAPHALVHIPGLDKPVVADAEGHFSQEVSYAAVKKHASHGRITATYSHKGKDRQVQIDLGP